MLPKQPTQGALVSPILSPLGLLHIRFTGPRSLLWQVRYHSKAGVRDTMTFTTIDDGVDMADILFPSSSDAPACMSWPWCFVYSQVVDNLLYHRSSSFSLRYYGFACEGIFATSCTPRSPHVCHTHSLSAWFSGAVQGSQNWVWIRPFGCVSRNQAQVSC
jgi:hypothetical protein